MKLWIQTLIIWGGVLCLAWGSCESNDDQLLHMRGKAFVHTVELLQQVKTKISEPPSVNVPVKTVSLRLPDRVALPIASYNLRCPVSATVDIPRCCAIAFREPEKTKIPAEMFLTCRAEGMVETGSGTPLTVKYPRQELFPDLPIGMTLAFRRTELDTRLPTPVFLSASHGTFISSVDIARASGFEVRRNMAVAPLLAYTNLKEITIMAKPAPATPEIPRCCAIAFREPEKTKIPAEMFLTCRVEDMPKAGSGTPLTLKGLQKELIVSLPSVVTLALRTTEIDSFLSAKTFSLTSSRESPVNLASTIPASGFELRRNLTGTQLPDMKEITIITTAILSTDNVRAPINLVRAEDHFDGISAGGLQITPFSISAKSVFQATGNSPASIPSIPAIKFNAVALQDREWTANPILVSYRHNVSSVGTVDSISAGFKIHITSPDTYLPELNEIAIAAKPVVSIDNVSSPIKIICADNIFNEISENSFHAAPLCLNAKSVLDAASSALICVPASPKLKATVLDNPASSLNPIIPRYFADTFAFNKANAALIRLNGLKTNGVLSVQIRQIMFASNLANTSVRSPCALTLHPSDPTIPQAIDRMLISGIIDEVRSGRINKRNPEIRAQLVQFLGDNPLGPTSQQVFSMILENFPGNALRRKIAALQAWAQEYAGGRYAPVLGYHIMHQFYRNKDYDAAIQFAESFLEKTKEFNDRVRFLQALCYAQKNNTTAALDVLQKIQHDYPESPMAPESKFLYAWIFYEDGNLTEAQTILKELVAKYPNSASAVKAVNLLEAINQKNSLAALKQ